MLFTNSSAIDVYMPQLGVPVALTQSYVNPPKFTGPGGRTAAGIFGSQVTALALNLAYERCAASFSDGCSYLSDLYVCDDPSIVRVTPVNCFNYFNWTVEEIFQKAEVALSGICSSNVSSCAATNGMKYLTVDIYIDYLDTSSEDEFSFYEDDDYEDDDEDCGDDDEDYERDTSVDLCDVTNLNLCVTLINTAFNNGKPGSLLRLAFSETPCI